jgi:hypothetical protein
MLDLKRSEMGLGEIKEITLPNGAKVSARVGSDGSVTPLNTSAFGGGSAEAPPPDFKNTQDLRKEYQATPEYKTYKAAEPIFQSMVETAPRNTRASDLNLVYGLAKIMDPNSVVREGETIMVKDTSNLSDWVVGEINRVNGGAGLLPETRQNVLTEARSRMQAYRDQAKGIQDQFFGVADTYKIPRKYIGSDLGDLPEVPQLGASKADASTPATSSTPTMDAGVLGSGQGKPKRRRYDPASGQFIEIPVGQ